MNRSSKLPQFVSNLRWRDFLRKRRRAAFTTPRELLGLRRDSVYSEPATLSRFG
jgi:hypothetical protein